MKLYVGNLASETSEADLRALFEPFGTVAEINIINDRMTGQSRGFAFVTMSNVTEGRAAIDGLQGKGLGGTAPHRQRGSRQRGSSQTTPSRSLSLAEMPPQHALGSAIIVGVFCRATRYARTVLPNPKKGQRSHHVLCSCVNGSL